MAEGQEQHPAVQDDVQEDADGQAGPVGPYPVSELEVRATRLCSWSNGLCGFSRDYVDV